MTTSKEFFAGVFSRHAAAYRDRHEVIRRSSQSRGRVRLLQLLAVRPGETVLDLCCGPGNLGAEIRALVPDARVIGVDLAPGMLALAREPAALGDAESLPFRNASFDAIACGHGLQFCPDLDAALREARHVLAPGGRMAASVPHSGRSSDAASRVLDRLLPPFPATPDRAKTMGVVGDPAAFAAAAESAGFASARVEKIDGDVAWSSPREMFQQALGWWSCAVRLEGLHAVDRDGLLEEAVQAYEAEHGRGPVVVPGSDLVLYASA